MHRRETLSGLVAIALLLVGAGCGSARVDSGDPGYVSSPQQYGGSYGWGSATGDTDAGASFARWVLDQDPRQELITDAVVRGEQTLGVKVQQTATKADAQRLLVALAEGMVQTFPGTPVKVIAFYQSGDKLAEANYDVRSRRTDVAFAR